MGAVAVRTVDEGCMALLWPNGFLRRCCDGEELTSINVAWPRKVTGVVQLARSS